MAGSEEPALSTADGSEPPPGVDPIEVHGQRAVVNDAASLAPRPGDSLVGTAKDILDESESGSPVSLLGRLGARIERIARSNRTAVSRLLETLDVQMAALHNYRPPGYAFWHIAASVLFAALVVSLLLLTGAVRGWGITEIDSSTRNILFGVGRRWPVSPVWSCSGHTASRRWPRDRRKTVSDCRSSEQARPGLVH